MEPFTTCRVPGGVQGGADTPETGSVLREGTAVTSSSSRGKWRRLEGHRGATTFLLGDGGKIRSPPWTSVTLTEKYLKSLRPAPPQELL